MPRRLLLFLKLQLPIATVFLQGCEDPSAKSAAAASGAGTIYLVVRSEYEVPLGHQVTRLEAGSVLGWFQRHWIDPKLRKEILGDDGWDLAGRLTTSALAGKSPYGFGTIFEAMAEWGKKPPANTAELQKFISGIDYPEGSISYRDGAIQCKTDDDEIDIAWYLFDEDYALRNPDRVAFLLHPEWRLDETAAETGALPATDTSWNLSLPDDDPAEGTVYCVFISALDGMTLDDITGCFRFHGVRLPELAEHLRKREIPVRVTRQDRESDWPEELKLVRALAQSSGGKSMVEIFGGAEAGHLNRRLFPARALSDFKHRGKSPRLLAGAAETVEEEFARLQEFIGSESQTSSWRHEMMPPLVQASAHFTQIRFHDRTKHGGTGDIHNTKAYLFFDDLWIAAHPELAQSILRYGASWDVLHEAEAEAADPE